MADFLGQSLGHPNAFWSQSSANPANFALNQTTDQVEWIFMTEEAVTITKLGFRYGVRTGTPPTYSISLQGVGTTGNPDGTIKGGGSPASATFTPPASTAWNSTWQWITLSNSYTATRGEALAIVIVYSSGTVSGSHNSSFTTSNDSGAYLLHPYDIQNNAGTRSRPNGMAWYGYASSSRAYGFPIQDIENTTIHAGTTPDEQALRFLLPATFGSTYKVRGARLTMKADTAGSTFKVILYDGTTVLQNVTLDNDFQGSVGSIRSYEIFFDEATLSTLNFGSVYRLALQPVGAAGIYFICNLLMAANADLSALPGGIQWYQSTRTDAGAWTDDTVRRPQVELIIDDWTVAAGSPFSIFE